MAFSTFKEVLANRSLVLEEDFEEEFSDVIEFLYSKRKGATSIVEKEDFGERFVQKEGMNQLRYTKELLSDLIEKAFFLEYSNENGKKKLIRKGNIFSDFSWRGNERIFTIKWNGFFFKGGVPKRVGYSLTKIYLSFLDFFRGVIGDGEEGNILISFDKFRGIIGLEKGKYCRGEKFVISSFINLLMIPNLEKLAEREGLMVEFEEKVVFVDKEAKRGVHFTVRRKK